MQLSTAEIAALRSTKHIFVADPDAAAGLFYGKLFEIDPTLRPMFPADVRPQGRKLVAAISVVIESVADWEMLGPVLSGLARQHVGYGVVPSHYAIVGRALIETLEIAGATSAQQHAWERAFGFIASFMIAQSAIAVAGQQKMPESRAS